MSSPRSARISDDTLFVLGAGVDVALGLPIMNDLWNRLNQFAQGEGKPVHEAIRSHVKNLRFKLDSYAGEQAEQLGERLSSTHTHLLPTLKSALDKHPDPSNEGVQALRTVIDRLEQIEKANQLPEDTVRGLSKLAGESTTDATGETLLSTRGWSFSPIPRQAMRRVFTALPGEITSLTDDEKEAIREVVAIVSNFEETLGDFFSGFFTRNLSNQKKYFYLSWLLWAYIRHKAQGGMAKRDGSFYQTLSQVGPGAGVITFNYTDFFCDVTRPTHGYFHGDCRAYIRFDTREYLAGDETVRDAITVEKMAAFIEGLDIRWETDLPRAYLPAIVPPLSVKPVVCTEYLERWFRCGEMMRQAGRIVIIGYSFNVADEHFNDLIRKGNGSARLVVINPEIERVAQHVCRVVGADVNSLNSITAQGFECMRGGRLVFVRAKAEDVDEGKLLALLS